MGRTHVTSNRRRIASLSNGSNTGPLPPPIPWSSYLVTTPTIAGTCPGYSFQWSAMYAIDLIGVPYEIRTRVAAVKGQCPGPLDERDRPVP